NECRQLLYTAYQYPGPAAVRYPRGTGTGVTIEKPMSALPIGKGRVIREGKEVALLCFGPLLATAQQVAEKFNYSLIDMRFVKPLDTELIEQMATSHQLLVTLEENAIAGGAGSGVCEYLNSHALLVPVLQLGFSDEFVDHASQKQQLTSQGLDAKSIAERISLRLNAAQTDTRLA